MSYNVEAMPHKKKFFLTKYGKLLLYNRKYTFESFHLRVTLLVGDQIQLRIRPGRGEFAAYADLRLGDWQLGGALRARLSAS